MPLALQLAIPPIEASAPGSTGKNKPVSLCHCWKAERKRKKTKGVRTRIGRVRVSDWMKKVIIPEIVVELLSRDPSLNSAVHIFLVDAYDLVHLSHVNGDSTSQECGVPLERGERSRRLHWNLSLGAGLHYFRHLLARLWESHNVRSEKSIHISVVALVSAVRLAHRRCRRDAAVESQDILQLADEIFTTRGGGGGFRGEESRHAMLSQAWIIEEAKTDLRLEEAQMAADQRSHDGETSDCFLRKRSGVVWPLPLAPTVVRRRRVTE